MKHSFENEKFCKVFSSSFLFQKHNDILQQRTESFHNHELRRANIDRYLLSLAEKRFQTDTSAEYRTDGSNEDKSGRGKERVLTQRTAEG